MNLRMAQAGVLALAVLLMVVAVPLTGHAEPYIGGGPDPASGTAAAKPVLMIAQGGQNAFAHFKLAGTQQGEDGTLVLDFEAADLRNLKAYQFVLQYDPSRYTVVSADRSEKNILATSELQFAAHSRAEGELLVDAATLVAPATGEGTLARFTLRSKTGGPVSLGDFSIADGILVDADGRIDPITAVELGALEALPTTFGLDQNMPNPFNPMTAISYQVPAAGHVRLVVYNSLGQEVRTLVDESVAPGVHSVAWDGKDNMGRNMATGVYLYRMTAGEFSQIRKMIFLK